MTDIKENGMKLAHEDGQSHLPCSLSFLNGICRLVNVLLPVK
jgi:hypothetical protein